MFASLAYSGVKGMSGQIKLKRVNVICGPNESGKSAAANALQLAVTGRCEVGAQASNQAKLLSGETAMATCTGKGIEASWSIRGGKRQWQDPQTQGNIPVSVDEFWKLTGAERLGLLVPEGALTEIQSRISKLEAEKSRLKEILNSPLPPTPDQYDGPPVHMLQQQLTDLEATMARHALAKQNKEANERKAAAAAQAKIDLEQTQRSLQSATALLAEHEAELALVQAQLAIYQEKSAREPRIIKSAREKGITIRQAVSQTGGLIGEVSSWLGINGLSAPILLEDLINCFPESLVEDIPEGVYRGSKCDMCRIERANAILEQGVNDFKRQVANEQRLITQLQQTLQFTDNTASDGMLSMDAYMGVVSKREELLGIMAKANAWSQYEAMTAQISAERVKANDALVTVQASLDAAKAEMTAKVDGLKSSVESLVNKYLAKVNLTPLTISISQTARGWSMDVTIGEIALEVMAKSRRLLYGICLLSAIQETSAATAPILVAECAEMQPETLDRCIEAMNLRTKGNVLLEHWHVPSVKTNLIMVGIEK